MKYAETLLMTKNCHYWQKVGKLCLHSQKVESTWCRLSECSIIQCKRTACSGVHSGLCMQSTGPAPGRYIPVEKNAAVALITSTPEEAL